jgi:SAM-dependent methyltransferase
VIATQPPDALPEGQLRPRGAYYTPDALALACARAVADIVPQPFRILEPGCGGGAFLRAAAKTWPSRRQLVGIDLVPACIGPGFVHQSDLFTMGANGCWDLIIGNPDFAIAEKTVRHCLSILPSGGHLAFLLRISFLASQARVALYREHPLFAFWPIAGRPSFTSGGSDTSEYGLFLWRKGAAAPGLMMQPLEWKGVSP